MPGTDVIIIGGGHNGLVAATYLARAGRAGDGARGDRPIRRCRGPAPGCSRAWTSGCRGSPTWSRYYPSRSRTDLGLDLELRSRQVASYTPIRGRRTAGGAYAGRCDPGVVPPADRRLRGVARLAGPGELPPAYARGRRADADRAAPERGGTAGRVRRRPGLGRTDADTRSANLIESVLGQRRRPRRGTHRRTDRDVHDRPRHSLRQNRCFTYHVIGGGTGEWKVPVGGMGRVADELERVAREAGAELVADARWRPC